MGANRDVRLNEMRSLFDLGLFPLSVCAGAAFNVAVTLILTVNLAEWIAIVLAVNLLPVVVLRVFTLKPGATYRPVREMSFFADQHKFPLWIYFLASANMTLWIVVSWLIFGRPDDPKLHFFLIVAAIAVTAFPAWIRLFHR